MHASRFSRARVPQRPACARASGPLTSLTQASGLLLRRPDLHLRGEGAMDGAVIDDLEQPGVLRGVERAPEDHAFPDLVDPGVAPRLAVGAVPGMDLPVAQAH